MHLICPHCHNPIEVVPLTPREEIACPSCGSSFHLDAGTTTGADTSPGRKLGKFTLIETLGQGAFGTVYKARDAELDRTVAIKVPRAGNLAGPQELDRFLREARSVAQLRHPSIVSVHAVGQQDGVPYLVSDFVQGVTLADLLSARRPGFRETAELMAAVADALQYAHEQGVVHRDVKPSNIMIGDDGKPSVMDFGLAKREAGEISMTVEGQVLGTPAYMPPEQARGEGHSVDARGDVYSLGVVLYQLLTGELPFRGTQRMLLHQVLHDEPRSLRRLNDSIPRDLETICLKCLRKEPARRYESAAALADDLRRFLAGSPIVARPVGRLERATKWVRRNPVLAGMMAVVVLALLAGAGVSTGFDIAERQQAKLATKSEADAVARGKELATTNENLTQTADDLKTVNETLTRTADDLKRTRDDLETTLARSLLRPFAMPDRSQPPITEQESEALWELATKRRGRLGYRFVEEASRTPGTSRQLRGRAALVFHAAVGLDEARRAEVETLLLARLEDPALSEEHKKDLALAASAWDGLGNAAVVRTARQLTRAMKDNKFQRDFGSLAEGLSALAPRLEASEAAQATAQAAAALTQAMKDNKNANDLSSLAQGLSALVPRMDPNEAAQAAAALTQAMKDTRNANAMWTLAPSLLALAPRLEPRGAAEAAIALTQAMKDTNDSLALQLMAQSLPAVAARLEPKEAAEVAAAIIQAIKDTKNQWALQQLPWGLWEVAARLEPKKAAEVAAAFTQAMMDPKNAEALYSLANGLAAVAARLEPKEAAQTAAVLTQAIKDSKFAYALPQLLQGLSAVAGRLDPKEAAEVAAALTQAMKDTKDENALFALARGLSAVAARTEPKEAAEAAAALTQAMKDSKNANHFYSLAEGLSAVIARMKPKEAAQAAAEAAAVFPQAMKDTKDANALFALARGLSAVAARMEPKQAAAALTQAMKDTKDASALSWLARGVSAVGARMEPKEAAQTAAQAAAVLTQAMMDPKNARTLWSLAEGLSVVAPRLDPKEAAQAAAALTQAMKDDKDPRGFPLFKSSAAQLAEGLSAVAPRLEPKEAAAILTGPMKDPRNASAVSSLARGLSAVAGRLEPKEAAEVAAVLTQAMKNNKDTRVNAPLPSLAQALSAVVARLDPREAAATLTQVMKDTKDGLALQYLAEGLSAVAARMEPKEAAQTSAQAAAALVQAMKGTQDFIPLRSPAQGLSALLSAVPPTEIRSTIAAAAVSFPAGTSHPLTAIVLIRAAESPPCRLSDQQLVELLKLPACVGEARRVVLDQLGNRYQRRFADVWEFVRFAQENLPDIDLLSPPQRPELAAVAH